MFNRLHGLSASCSRGRGALGLGNRAPREVDGEELSYRTERRGAVEVISCEPQKNDLAGPASTDTAATDLWLTEGDFQEMKASQ